MTLDGLPFDYSTPATPTGAKGKTCRRHQWGEVLTDVVELPRDLADAIHVMERWQEFGPFAYVTRQGTKCRRCGALRDESRARRGRNNRTRGNRAELDAARKYGGTKIGPLGGPSDITGKDFATQVKTHQRPAPVEWRKVFAALSQDRRCPRLLLRFLEGQGIAADDYFVFRASDFLAWFGKDEP